MIIRRTILKQELAVKLYPDSINAESAMQLLRKEIRRTPSLQQRLFKDYPKSNTPYFNHKQLEVLLEHYCITVDEFCLL
ncbi:DUF4248 domain-containing protein [Saccharicrinis sp. 156]|uniref:DUF4248 domain-containing protein n=1 Tax=Saccharicrinis sp. 156 TaxID=3417574 RepID=UPI003D332912